MLCCLINRRVDLAFRDIADASGQLIEVILVLAKQARTFLAGRRLLEDVRRPDDEALIIVQRSAEKALDGLPLVGGNILDVMNHTSVSSTALILDYPMRLVTPLRERDDNLSKASRSRTGSRAAAIAASRSSTAAALG